MPWITSTSSPDLCTAGTSKMLVPTSSCSLAFSKTFSICMLTDCMIPFGSSDMMPMGAMDNTLYRSSSLRFTMNSVRTLFAGMAR